MTDGGLANSNIEILVIRSARRSIAGQVLPNGNIEVRAPFSMTTDEIIKFLVKFEHKFMPIITQRRAVNASLAAHPFGYGGEVLFMGEWTPMREAEDGNNGYIAQYKDGAVVIKPGLSEDDLRHQIGDVFSTLAMPIFADKLRYYSDIMSVRCKTWTIGNAKKRHGSCDSNGKITLSWRIVMMSAPVIEYIIVHELAHLKHMNHSKAFRAEVAAVLPDWQERKRAYSEYSLLLLCGGWI